MNRPFLWGWAAAAIILFLIMLRIRAPRVRATVLVMFGVSCAMFLAEGAAAAHNAGGAKAAITSEYDPTSLTWPDRELGYSLNPGARVLATRRWFDSTLFRVTYTINDAGARETRGNPQGETWLFVGCSFTFGEGVEDSETLPARFSEELGWKANVVNLGVTGYGPHQILRALEIGRLAGARRPVKHVIYQAIPYHAARVAGRAPWDLDGPSYRISGDSVAFTGPFLSKREIRALRIIRTSDVGSLLDQLYREMPPRDSEIGLYVRIVNGAAALARAKLGADFTILFWDDDANPTSKLIFDRLVATGLPVIRTTSFMTRHELESLIIPHDGHPTPESYRRLAKGLARYFGETP